MTAEDIFLLDEAFAALDSITRNQMQLWLLEMKEKLDNTILLITHDIDEAIMLSDRIYIISKIPAIIKKRSELILTAIKSGRGFSRRIA